MTDKRFPFQKTSGIFDRLDAYFLPVCILLIGVVLVLWPFAAWLSWR